MQHLLLILIFLFPTITFASGGAPWCHVRDENENCAYKTKEDCYSVAQYGGSCRENTRFMGSSGERRWCVVTSSRRSCTFGGKGMCLRAARELGGGCVENTEMALEQTRSGRSPSGDEEFVFDDYSVEY